MVGLPLSAGKDKHVGRRCGKMCHGNCLSVLRAEMKHWNVEKGEVENKVLKCSPALSSS